MNSDIKKLWIAALLSGEYTQGRKVLRGADDTYCCLGVLCDLHRKAVGGKWCEVDKDIRNPTGIDCLLLPVRGGRGIYRGECRRWLSIGHGATYWSYRMGRY